MLERVPKRPYNRRVQNKERIKMAGGHGGTALIRGNLDMEEAEKALEVYLKRQAIHVVSHLPDDTAQALRVLELANRIIKRFLADDDDGEDSLPRPSLRVVD